MTDQLPHRQAGPPDIARRFRAVTTWVFDLDNTLYAAGGDLWPRIDQRITVFMADMFGLDGLSARALQKHYYRRYGTTLRGLMLEHDVSAQKFLDFTDDIDRSSLAPNPRLAAVLAALPGRRLILTNGSRHHALRTAEQLGIAHLFEDVFDIIAANLVPKPDAENYEAFFVRHGVAPSTSAMFEDLPRNLLVPHQRGMATTLVIPRIDNSGASEEWIATPEAAPHIDFITDDLAGFLESISVALT